MGVWVVYTCGCVDVCVVCGCMCVPSLPLVMLQPSEQGPFILRGRLLMSLIRRVEQSSWWMVSTWQGRWCHIRGGGVTSGEVTSHQGGGIMSGEVVSHQGR